MAVDAVLGELVSARFPVKQGKTGKFPKFKDRKTISKPAIPQNLWLFYLNSLKTKQGIFSEDQGTIAGYQGKIQTDQRGENFLQENCLWALSIRPLPSLV